MIFEKFLDSDPLVATSDLDNSEVDQRDGMLRNTTCEDALRDASSRIVQ